MCRLPSSPGPLSFVIGAYFGFRAVFPIDLRVTHQTQELYDEGLLLPAREAKWAVVHARAEGAPINAEALKTKARHLVQAVAFICGGDRHKVLHRASAAAVALAVVCFLATRWLDIADPWKAALDWLGIACGALGLIVLPLVERRLTKRTRPSR